MDAGSVARVPGFISDLVHVHLATSFGYTLHIDDLRVNRFFTAVLQRTEMRIRRNKGLSIPAVAFAIGFGVISGFYIWKPAIIREVERQKLEREQLSKSEKSTQN